MTQGYTQSISNWGRTVLLLAGMATMTFGADGDGEATLALDPDSFLEGHSVHGEAFNEGPRQRAYLMEGLGRVHFPITANDPMAKKFVSQGLAQLHGFWYFEAERSFRQAAAIEPECAMAYWGMALANRKNSKRAKEFLENAIRHKETASHREQLYIDAADQFFKEKDRKKGKAAYAKALEKLCYEYPDDIEAKALLALQLWENRSKDKPISYLAVDALIGQVLDVEPMHPIHHYRIHLWDDEKPAIALTSAARCGQSLPSIAHMWHMPGHIFSKLKRYDDAAWQQEASARVDHAHMMRDRVMPDQIHNYAHNNEWLIRNLNHVGRIRDAIDLAKNMTELPRHPKYNTLSKRGSANYGRQRLFQTLSRFELWDELIALADTPYLEPTSNENEQVKRWRLLGRAYFRKGYSTQGKAQLALLNERLAELEPARDDAIAKAESKAQEDALDLEAIEAAIAEAEEKVLENDVDAATFIEARGNAEKEARKKQLEDHKDDIKKAKKEAGEEFNSKIKAVEEAIAELEGHKALVCDKHEEALELFKKAKRMDPLFLASVRLKAGETEKAIEDAQKHVDSHKNEVQPLALLADLLWNADKKDDATRVFRQLQEISGNIDLESPVFERLKPLVCASGSSNDWRTPKPPAEDLGTRPRLESLGPFRWQPSLAPDWTLKDARNKPRSLEEFRGAPVVVIFYLGAGCLHCAEQLHTFAPMLDDYKEAGIEMVAISSDDASGLKESIENYDKGDLPIQLLSNGDLDIFKAYRCYDDFEDQPLHGTFLIDADGLVRWQDISYEPFMDPKFLLEESRRLLNQSGSQGKADVNALSARVQ